MATTAPNPDRVKVRATAIALAVLAVGIVVVAVLILSSLNGGEDDAAVDACKDQTEAVLKAPSTAEWGDFTSQRFEDGTYKVTGWVDAQNGFGAQIRSDVTCKVSGQLVVDFNLRP